MYEQFVYYRRTLAYEPGCTYVGNVSWPCCAINTATRASHPEVSDLADDLRHAVAWAQKRPLWLLLPSGRQGHWSAEVADTLASVPGTMNGLGCAEVTHVSFDQTQLVGYQCR
jgi:hypothetical protein